MYSERGLESLRLTDCVAYTDFVLVADTYHGLFKYHYQAEYYEMLRLYSIDKQEPESKSNVPFDYVLRLEKIDEENVIMQRLINFHILNVKTSQSYRLIDHVFK